MKNPLSLFIICLGPAVGAGAACLYMFEAAHAKITRRPPVQLPVKAGILFNSDTDCLGDKHSLYTLVEFFDYQCPPCRRSYAQVEELLKAQHGRLRLVVHHFPLKMHPLAVPAAELAEAARAQGRFWDVHAALFHAPTLDGKTIDRIASTFKIKRPDLQKIPGQVSARTDERIRKDMRLAKTVGVDATPTFILCRDDEVCFRLGTLKQVDALIAR